MPDTERVVTWLKELVAQYGGDHLSIDAHYTLCGKPITDTWEQIARGRHICNRCRRSEELLEQRLAAVNEDPRP